MEDNLIEMLGRHADAVLHKITKLTSTEKNKNKNKKDFNYVLTKFTSYTSNKERRKINCPIETHNIHGKTQ